MLVNLDLEIHIEFSLNLNATLATEAAHLIPAAEKSNSLLPKKPSLTSFGNPCLGLSRHMEQYTNFT